MQGFWILGAALCSIAFVLTFRETKAKDDDDSDDTTTYIPKPRFMRSQSIHDEDEPPEFLEGNPTLMG